MWTLWPDLWSFHFRLADVEPEKLSQSDSYLCLGEFSTDFKYILTNLHIFPCLWWWWNWNVFLTLPVIYLMDVSSWGNLSWISPHIESGRNVLSYFWSSSKHVHFFSSGFQKTTNVFLICSLSFAQLNQTKRNASKIWHVRILLHIFERLFWTPQS